MTEFQSFAIFQAMARALRRIKNRHQGGMGVVPLLALPPDLRAPDIDETPLSWDEIRFALSHDLLKARHE